MWCFGIWRNACVEMVYRFCYDGHRGCNDFESKPKEDGDRINFRIFRAGATTFLLLFVSMPEATFIDNFNSFLSGFFIMSSPVFLHWYRKGLRLHDNPGLLAAIDKANSHRGCVRPIYIIDRANEKYLIGANRWRFLIDSLKDLDKNLKSVGMRLYVLQGKTDDVFKKLINEWKIKGVTYEIDTDKFTLERDAKLADLLRKEKVDFDGYGGHNLYDIEMIIKANGGSAPTTFKKLMDVMTKVGDPPKPSSKPKKVNFKDDDLNSKDYGIPTLKELKINESELGPYKFKGGESEGLARLESVFKRKGYVENFSKPQTAPTAIEPATTVLSPYLNFGCLSARTFYEKLQTVKKTKYPPPTNLMGQLLWREFYYIIGYETKNFYQIKGNPICKQIDWDDDTKMYEAWKEGRTGYPWIDAIMIQLKTEGWIHHLARHATACFATRGDLWLPWDKAQRVFEEWLLDFDPFSNAGNWMWLSASAFFYQYYRCYSPIKFPQKTDKTGDFVRKYLPVLKDFPAKYIYEPWNAPIEVQKKANCIIGKDYPKPIVDHETISKRNTTRMNAFYGHGTSDKGNANEEKKKSQKRYSSSEESGSDDDESQRKPKKMKKVKKEDD